MLPLNLFPLDIRRLRGDLILTFRLFAENQASSFFTLAGESSLRGHDKKVLKPHCRTSTRLRFFSVRLIQPWNSLLRDVVCASSFACFKTRLDTFLGLVGRVFLSLSFTSTRLIYINYIFTYNVRVQCYTISFCICFLQVNSDPITAEIQ